MTQNEKYVLYGLSAIVIIGGGIWAYNHFSVPAPKEPKFKSKTDSGEYLKKHSSASAKTIDDAPLIAVVAWANALYDGRDVFIVKYPTMQHPKIFSTKTGAEINTATA